MRAARLWRHRRLCPGPAAGITAALPPSPAMARRRRRNRADRHLRRPGDPHRAPALPAAPGPQRRPEWAAASIGAAWGITTHWAQDPYRWPRLRSRWQDRASRLGLTGPPSQPAVTFPEVVALAQVLTDLGWRCHVAMVREWQLDLFCQRIARRLGEPFCQAPSRSDPIVTRAAGHRNMLPGSATTSAAFTSAPGPSPLRSPKKASSDETTTQPAVSRELANPEVRTCPVARPNET